jgi:hypothetical protein
MIISDGVYMHEIAQVSVAITSVSGAPAPRWVPLLVIVMLALLGVGAVYALYRLKNPGRMPTWVRWLLIVLVSLFWVAAFALVMDTVIEPLITHR